MSMSAKRGLVSPAGRWRRCRPRRSRSRSYVARATVLKSLTYRLAVRPVPTITADQRRGARSPEASAAPLGMHPDPLDLADRRRLRPDLGLEDHLAVFEAGPRPSGRDQAGDPAAVAAPAVAEPRVDADLADEHVDRRHQIGVEFVRLDLPHTGIDRAGRHRGQRHQRLTVTHIARRPPGRLEALPHRHHQLGAPDQRRAASRAGQRRIGERIQVVEPAAQRNQVGAGVTQRLVGPAARPQLPADRVGVHAVIGDPARPPCTSRPGRRRRPGAPTRRRAQLTPVAR